MWGSGAAGLLAHQGKWKPDCPKPCRCLMVALPLGRRPAAVPAAAAVREQLWRCAPREAQGRFGAGECLCRCALAIPFSVAAVLADLAVGVQAIVCVAYGHEFCAWKTSSAFQAKLEGCERFS